MRFDNKRFLDGRDVGKTRTITKFALWPVTIRNETRWLEKVTYQEKVEYYSEYLIIYRWVPFKFID